MTSGTATYEQEVNSVLAAEWVSIGAASSAVEGSEGRRGPQMESRTELSRKLAIIVRGAMSQVSADRFMMAGKPAIQIEANNDQLSITAGLQLVFQLLQQLGSGRISLAVGAVGRCEQELAAAEVDLGHKEAFPTRT